MKMNKKGFTLVEIMIVVAIIGILAAIAIPNFVRYRKTAQANACVGNLKQIQSASEQAFMNGKTSITSDDLVGSDKYIKATPLCPTTKTFSYNLGTVDDNTPTCNNNTETDAAYAHKLPDNTAS